jgi:hypothetical protein
MWLPLIESAAVVAAGGAALWFLPRSHRDTGPRVDPAVAQAVAGAVMAQVHTPGTGAGVVSGEAFERVWAAAEQAGWLRLLAEGVLRPVSRRLDPGNPLGTRLVLAEHVAGGFGDVRVLLAVNACPGPDGAHELVAIPVPAGFDDALAAAAWTYDDPHHPVATTPAGYAGLARRT